MRSELLRVEPDAHRIFGRERLDIADAVHAPQFVEHARVGEVVDLHRVGVAAFRGDRDDQQETGIGFRDRDSLTADILRQPLFDAAKNAGIGFYLGYAEIAKERKLPLIEDAIPKVLSDTNLKGDQIHPNAAGHAKLGELIHADLKKIGFAG